MVFALINKELKQILRDFSSILIAFILPVILLFLFGFGINFDTNTVKIGVILENLTYQSRLTLDSLRFSRFLDISLFSSKKDAESALNAGRIRGFVVIPNDFSRNYKSAAAQGNQALKTLKTFNGARYPRMPEIQIITDGSEPNTAKFVSAYVLGALENSRATETAKNSTHSEFKNSNQAKITVIQRFWYNPALKSTYFVLPGSLAIIMTMIGTVLTALVIAREWERGTMEALLTTKMTKGEFLLSKYTAYFLLSIASILFCFFMITVVFRVPFYGSFPLFMLTSALFMLGALGFGFLVSTYAKDQFVASQIAGVVAFMPAMMLSGLIYEINSMPVILRFLTYFIPARYYVSSISSLFLSGTILSVILLNALILGLFALLMFIVVYIITPVRYEKEG